MRVHHLNCGTMILGVVDHCLLIETDGGSLVLVDTGFGMHSVRRPAVVGWTRHVVRPELRESQTAIVQIRALGYDPTDVQNIVVTHLDYDHTAGLADFPWATVHVHDVELAAGRRPGLIRGIRYRPDHMWGRGVEWRVHHFDPADRTTWIGFAARELSGAYADLLLVSLPGHTDGHIGVAVHTDTG